MKTLEVSILTRTTRWLGYAAALGVVLAVYFLLNANPTAAQTPAEATRRADEALNAPTAGSNAAPIRTSATGDQPKEMNLLDLYLAGGIFMIPITLLSLVALAFTVERAFALRRIKVITHELVEGLCGMSDDGGLW